MSNDSFAQTVVNEASDAVQKIFTDQIVAPTPVNERAQAWSTGIQEMREQLAFVKSVVQEGVRVPQFLISLHMHLDALQPGQWPQWAAIRQGNVSLNPDNPWLRMCVPTPPVANAEVLANTPASSAPCASSGPAIPSSTTTAEPPSTILPVPTTIHQSNPEATNIPSQSTKPDKGKGKAKESDEGAQVGPTTTRETRLCGHSVPRADDKCKGKCRSKTVKHKRSEDKDDEDKEDQSQRATHDVEEKGAKEDSRGQSHQREAPRNRTQCGKSCARSKVPEASTSTEDTCPSDTQDECDRCVKLGRTCVPIEGRACNDCYNSKVKCSMVRKRTRSSTRPPPKSPSARKASLSLSSIPTSSKLPECARSPSPLLKSPSGSGKNNSTSPPPPKCSKHVAPRVFKPDNALHPTAVVKCVQQMGARKQLFEGVVIQSQKGRSLIVPTPTAQSTLSAEPSIQGPTVPKSTDFISRAVFNALQDTCQQLHNQQVAQEQFIKSLEERVVVAEHGLETFGRVLHEVWPQSGRDSSSLSSLQFPFAVGMGGPRGLSDPQTPPQTVSPPTGPSSPIPRMIVGTQTRHVSPSTPRQLFPGSEQHSAHLRPSPFLSPTTQTSGTTPVRGPIRPCPFLSPAMTVTSTMPEMESVSLLAISPLGSPLFGTPEPDSSSLLLSSAEPSASMECEDTVANVIGLASLRQYGVDLDDDGMGEVDGAHDDAMGEVDGAHDNTMGEMDGAPPMDL